MADKLKRPTVNGLYDSLCTTPRAGQMMTLLGAGQSTGPFTFSRDEFRAVQKLYGYQAEQPNQKPPPPAQPVREDFQDDWAYRDALRKHQEALKAHQKWKDPIDFMQAGADRNCMRHAEADGLRLYRDNGRWVIGFTNAWVGVAGWTVRTPRGQVTFTPKLAESGRIEPLVEKGSERFWTFCYKAGLKDAATAFLETMGQTVVQNILKPVDPRTLQNTGTCPCCFVNTKMVKGRMIRHGWSVSGQRQRGVLGLTFHSGPCFGTGYQPFELSPQGTKDYLKLALTPAIKNTEDQIFSLKGRPEKLVVEINGKAQDIPQGHRDYDRYLAQQMLRAEKTQKALEAERADLQQRVAGWEPKPLPGMPGH